MGRLFGLFVRKLTAGEIRREVEKSATETPEDVLAAMRKKERELWDRNPKRLGCFAAALLIGGYRDRMEAALDRERAKSTAHGAPS